MSLALVATLAITVVGLLTAGSIAVRSVSRIWLRHWVERRLAGASLAELYLERPQRLIVSAGTGIALAVFLAGAAVATLGAAPSVLGARLIALAVGILLLGQVLPRALARRWPVHVVPPLVPVLRVVDALVAPPRLAGAMLAGLVAGRGPVAAAESARDSIEDLLREGQLEGVGETEEMAIITGVVQFGEKAAREVMTPREQVFALDAALPPAELARAVAGSAYSRIPIYRGSLDDVLGVVHAFDLLQCDDGATPPVRPAYATDADTPCNTLLFALLRTRRHLAVVRDAAGRTLGIVTLEDLLEELVGDIRDEHDEPVPAAPLPPSPRPAS